MGAIEFGNKTRTRSRGGAREATTRLIGLAATAVLATACSAAASSSAPAPSSSAAFRASPTTATPATILTSLPTATPLPAATPLPSVGLAAPEAWKGVRWISGGKAFPMPSGHGARYVQVSGWSHGFVGFRLTDPTAAAGQAIESTTSADGLRWTAPKRLDLRGSPGLSTVRVVEGHGGLLAAGYPQPATCGGPPPIVRLWWSSDGAAWTPVPLPAAATSSMVYTLEGGPSGYIATGKVGDAPAIWLSRDGRSWRRTTALSRNAAEVTDGVVFAGRYVVSGASRVDSGCGGTEYAPRVWSSSDGKAWASERLPSVTTGDSVWVYLVRIDDRTMVAIADEWDNDAQTQKRAVWVTSDARTWRSIASPSPWLTDLPRSHVHDGIALVEPSGLDGLPKIARIADDLTVTTLPQSGGGPVESSDNARRWSYAFGPTGILAIDDLGDELWLGVPAG